VVLITVTDAACAEMLARALLEERLAACVNVVPGVRSFYRWDGAIQEDSELLLLAKRRRRRPSWRRRILAFTTLAAILLAGGVVFLLGRYLASGRARLTLEAEGSAEVYLDGHLLGLAPITGQMVAPGGHRVRWVDPQSGAAVERSLSLAPGEVVHQRVDMGEAVSRGRQAGSAPLSP